jgi:hypothetical protein
MSLDIGSPSDQGLFAAGWFIYVAQRSIAVVWMRPNESALGAIDEPYRPECRKAVRLVAAVAVPPVLTVALIEPPADATNRRRLEGG